MLREMAWRYSPERYAPARPQAFKPETAQLRDLGINVPRGRRRETAADSRFFRHGDQEVFID